MPLIMLCDGVVSENLDSSPICSSSWTVTDYVIVQPFDIASLDPLVLAEAFGAGWIIIASYWSVTFGYHIILELLKR